MSEHGDCHYDCEGDEEERDVFEPDPEPQLSCPYCEDADPRKSDGCQARLLAEDSRFPWYCTRPKNHPFPHVACGRTTHELALWPRDPNVLAATPEEVMRATTNVGA